MLFTVKTTEDPHELLLEGTVDEIKSDVEGYGDSIAGYQVGGVTIGQHDGARAHVFHLFDSMGQRSVGRLALRDDALRDARLEWRRWFDTEEEAARYRNRFLNPPAPQDDDVITLRLDMSFDETDAERGRLFAEWAGTYGCMFQVVNEFGPAAGNPEVEVTGFRARVRTWLKAEYCNDGTESPEFYLGESES